MASKVALYIGNAIFDDVFHKQIKTNICQRSPFLAYFNQSCLLVNIFLYTIRVIYLTGNIRSVLLGAKPLHGHGHGRIFISPANTCLLKYNLDLDQRCIMILAAFGNQFFAKAEICYTPFPDHSGLKLACINVLQALCDSVNNTSLSEHFPVWSLTPGKILVRWKSIHYTGLRCFCFSSYLIVYVCNDNKRRNSLPQIS